MKKLSQPSHQLILAMAISTLTINIMQARPIESANDLLFDTPINSALTNDQGEHGNGPTAIQNVARLMHQAAVLLQRLDTADSVSSEQQPHSLPLASPIQEQIISELDILIQQFEDKEKQCRGNGKPKSTQSTNKKGKSNRSGQAGKSPATSAPKTTTTGAPKPLLFDSVNQLVNDLWGQLPERGRQQILQPLSEDFLPKYAPDIEEYFRALAEPDNSQDK